MRVVYSVDTKPGKPLFASKSLASDFIGFSYNETNTARFKVNNHIMNLSLYDSIDEALLDYGISKNGKPLLKRFVAKMDNNFKIEGWSVYESKVLVGLINKYAKEHSKPKILAIIDKFGVYDYPNYYLVFTVNITNYMKRYQTTNRGKMLQKRLKNALKMAKTILQPKLYKFILSWDVDPIFVKSNTPESVFDTFGFNKLPSENKNYDVYQYVFDDIDDILWG